jgi:uncharacterized protein (DUF1501 family)
MTPRTPSRRDVLKAAGLVAGLQLFAPVMFRGEAWGEVDPATANRYRLILVDLFGGNDGLSTVVPKSGAIRDVYQQVRTLTELPADPLRYLGEVEGGTVGLHANLITIHQLWQQDRVAIVQGVDYPNHNYSHFVSDDIWQSADLARSPHSGWLGRHLDRAGIGEGELRGVGIGGILPLALHGEQMSGEQVSSLGETQFPDGAAKTGQSGKRHGLFATYDTETAGLGAYYGDKCRDAYDLAVATTGLSAAAPGGVSNQLLTARELLTANLGVEVVVVTTGGYDTHDNQVNRHAALMRDLDRGIEAFYYGTRDGNPIMKGATAGNGLPDPIGTVGNPGTPIGPCDPNLAARTLIVTFSEFGRRIGDNGPGTDHGAAGPMFMIGPPAPASGSGAPTLTPGLHRDHPSLGTVLAPADNLAMTTDFRSVYQSILRGWLSDPGESSFVVGGTGVETDGTLTGLFGIA